jgi:hypothetical protein
MEEIKMKVADFAGLIGCSQKTVYKLIENNQLKTVNELQNGRTIRLIVTNNIEITEFQKNYGKLPVSESECNEILTVNNVQNNKMNVQNVSESENILNVFDKIMEVNNQYNERLEKVNNELITYKSKQLLLEDKASREGLYLSEINDLKTSKNNILKWLISVIVILSLLLITVSGLLIFDLYNSVNIPSTIEVTKEKAGN